MQSQPIHKLEIKEFISAFDSDNYKALTIQWF